LFGSGIALDESAGTCAAENSAARNNPVSGIHAAAMVPEGPATALDIILDELKPGLKLFGRAVILGYLTRFPLMSEWSNACP
jgi:hypothetical protein